MHAESLLGSTMGLSSVQFVAELCANVALYYYSRSLSFDTISSLRRVTR